jgi:large subunit ribosomal protein L13
MHTIDATGKKLGRVASEAAKLLMGKHKTSFVKHKIIGDQVKIENVSKLDMTNKKMGQKTYSTYSGYPGGLKKETMASMIDAKGYTEVVKKAVYGMLPNNKLRKDMLKNLDIRE